MGRRGAAAGATNGLTPSRPPRRQDTTDERRRQRELALAEALALAKVGDPDAAGFLRAFSTHEVRRCLLPLGIDGSAADDIVDELFTPTTLATYEDASSPPSLWIRRTAWCIAQQSMRRAPLARVPVEDGRGRGEAQW